MTTVNGNILDYKTVTMGADYCTENYTTKNHRFGSPCIGSVTSFDKIINKYLITLRTSYFG